MTPISYHPDVEKPASDEQQTFDELSEMFQHIQQHVLDKTGTAKHGTHAKATAHLTGHLVVSDGLPAELAQGLFARPGRYDTLVRFSQGPSEEVSDSASGQRGMAIKVLGVIGEHVAGSRETTTQDWVLSVNDRAFTDADAKAFLHSFRETAGKSTYVPESVLVAGSRAARVTEAALEKVGLGVAHVRFFGQPPEHPAGSRYYSQAPLRHGDYIAQLAVVPTDQTFAAIGELHLRNSPDRFRDAMVDFFSRHDAEFEVRVQLCTDLDEMPIEDASVPWPEDQSPFRTVGRLILPRQSAYSDDRREYFDDRLAFNPIHALEEHRPLGSIMRSRMHVYLLTQDFRQHANAAPSTEPRSLAEVP